MVTSIALTAVELFGLYFWHANRWAVGTMVALVGISIAGYATTLQNRILMVAPGSTDIASAIGSATFNVGIASGGLLGGRLLAGQGILSVTLIGGVVVAAALAVLLVEPLIASRRTGTGEAFGDGPNERRTTVGAT